MPTSDATPFGGVGTPQLSCSGHRTSKFLEGVVIGQTHNISSDINDTTKSMFCAGQLSMILPPQATMSTSSVPDDALVPAALGSSPLSLFPVRCSGVSIRFDTIEEPVKKPAALPQAEVARPSLPAVPSHTEEVQRPSVEAHSQNIQVPRPNAGQAGSSNVSAGGSGADSLQERFQTAWAGMTSSRESQPEWAQAALKGAETVASRAGRMVSLIGEAAGQTNLKEFPARTKEQTEKICSQAVKIVKRGGDIMSPWQAFGGGDSKA